MKKTLTIVDTYGFFFRNFYGMPPLKSKSGFPTGLLTGFIHFVNRLEKEFKDDYIAFALARPGCRGRHGV